MYKTLLTALCFNQFAAVFAGLADAVLTVGKP